LSRTQSSRSIAGHHLAEYYGPVDANVDDHQAAQNSNATGASAISGDVHVFGWRRVRPGSFNSVDILGEVDRGDVHLFGEFKAAKD